MRGPAFAFLASALLCACSAVDDFGKFHFVEDGGHPGGDMAGGGLPGFDEACTTACAPGPSAPARPLMCYMMFGTRPVPGGDCTRTCVAGLPISCTDYGEAVCRRVENMDVCLRSCNPSLGHNCRSGFDCCASGMPTTGQGACAPANTDFCGQ